MFQLCKSNQPLCLLTSRLLALPALPQLLAAALAQHRLPDGSRALAGHRLLQALDQPPQKIAAVPPTHGPAAPVKAAAGPGWQMAASAAIAAPAPQLAEPSSAAAVVPPVKRAAAAAVPAVPLAAPTPPAADEASLRRALAEDCAVPLSYLRSLLFA